MNRRGQSSSRISPLVQFDDASLIRNPLRTLAKAALIVLVALIVGTIVPGIIAYRAGVFYQATMVTRLPADARKQLAEFDARRDSLRKQIAEMDRTLEGAVYAKPEDIASLLTQRSQYVKELETTKPAIHVMPFYLNTIMFLWTAGYTTLGWLIFLAAPRRTSTATLSRRSIAKIVATAACVYTAYNWPVWMRNFILSNEGRLIYSFANYDIAPASFWCQEATTLLFALLVAVVWSQWIAFLEERRAELSVANQDPHEYALDHKVVEGLSLTFLHWQIASTLLGVTFFHFSAVFWDHILRKGDLRYVVPAVTIHICWLASWILVTLPLLLTWYWWQSIRLRAICDAAREAERKKAEYDGLEALKKTLAEIQPIGVWNLAASGIIAVVSFVLPVAQAILK
jgi:hypothetical protein